ncbi:hypothetical protein PIROE2DRAFT_64864 [Piromyces sp. E2]|nr:hypothetical protein PIROE2DRAFT_64864 [Piromyces sp. E2]|eukprot:OUM57687.1 hypothetical protein PIROE2DRAFT_64864 [Piromyces sp. E2]
MKEENFYELPIENWSKLTEDWNISSSFNIGNYDWCIKLIPNNGGYTFLKLYNYGFLEKYNNESIYFKYVFSIRNPNDYSCFIMKPLETFQHFTNDNHFGIIYDQFLKESDLFKITESQNKSLIESDKTVVSIYIQVYDIKDEVDEIEEDENVVNVMYDFNGNDQNELDLYKDRPLKVLEWNIQEGWSYGYHIIGDNKIKGLFPTVLVRKNNFNIEEDLSLTEKIKEKIAKYSSSSSSSLFMLPSKISQQVYKDNSDLVLVLYDFSGEAPEELSIQKGMYLRVTDWNIKEGWSLGYKVLDNKKRGIFPTVFVTGKIIDKREQYMKEIRNLLTTEYIKEEEEDNGIIENFYEWKIRSFGDFQNGTKKRDSVKFKACDNQWKLEIVFDKKLEKENDYFSVFLKNLSILNDEEYINAKFVLEIDDNIKWKI